MKEIAEFIPFLVPILVIELALAITALIHVIRHPKYRFGNKAIWILVVLLFQIIGPIIYFVFGRGEE